MLETKKQTGTSSYKAVVLSLLGTTDQFTEDKFSTGGR